MYRQGRTLKLIGYRVARPGVRVGWGHRAVELPTNFPLSFPECYVEWEVKWEVSEYPMDTERLESIVRTLRLVGTDSQPIEVKSNVGKSIRETLSAFANANGGTIIVGLDESNGFLPVDGFDAAKTGHTRNSMRADHASGTSTNRHGSL